MGNQCCNQRGIMSDNTAENLILDSMHYYRNKLKNQKEISQLIINIFHTTLFDIEANPYQWITQELYADFLNSIEKKQPEGDSIFLAPNSRQFSQPSYQKCLYLNYADVNITNSSYKNLFHILLNIWLIGITTSSTKKKLEYIKRIILKVSNINSYVNFCKFLKTYLEIFLIELTQNYSLCDEMNTDNRVEMNKLVVSIYTWENVENFLDFLMKRLKKIICLQKSQLKSENIDNEYLTDDIFNRFFEENLFLLDPIELRLVFYNKYSVSLLYQMKIF